MSKLKPGMLKGKAYTEDFIVEFLGEEFEVEIRPLKHSEAAEVQNILMKSFNIKGTPKQGQTPDFELNNEEYTKAQFSAVLKAAAYGTVDADWTEDLINEEWPSEIINVVGQRVLTITGIGNPEDVERFRKERSGK